MKKKNIKKLIIQTVNELDRNSESQPLPLPTTEEATKVIQDQIESGITKKFELKWETMNPDTPFTKDRTNCVTGLGGSGALGAQQHWYQLITFTIRDNVTGNVITSGGNTVIGSANFGSQNPIFGTCCPGTYYVSISKQGYHTLSGYVTIPHVGNLQTVNYGNVYLAPL